LGCVNGKAVPNDASDAMCTGQAIFQIGENRSQIPGS
jgi:hypothetical protein